jgi:hypothetical protein
MTAGFAADAERRAVILVEGKSDQTALETLARRRHRMLVLEGVEILSMGGVTNVGHYLKRYGPEGVGLRIAGLYDAAAQALVGRAMERAGFGRIVSIAELESSGFYGCDRDLEDELIRALGPDTVEEIIESQGELHSLRIMQQQPAQRERSVHDQLHRFMGTTSGRKDKYAHLMVEALDLTQVPSPLDSVLRFI